MCNRLYLAFIAAALLFALPVSYSVHVALATSPSLTRTYTVQMTYVRSDNYKNRLVNARAAFDQLQAFFDRVTFKRGVNYSFLHDVLHDNMTPEKGYVNTEKGYAFGACGASSLLNKLVQTATFRDKDGKVKPVFQAILVWTWKGDKTYGKYGATIYLDLTGKRINKDYVWRLNPAYDGPSPRITSQFDMDAMTVSLTMSYADEVAEPASVQATPGKPTATLAKTALSTPTPVLTADVSADKSGDPAGSDLTKSDRALALTRSLQAIIGERRFGVSILPVGNATQVMDEVGVNQNDQLFVASAFKGPVALYFFENVDAAVWNSVPVRYWEAKTPDQVPAAYREAWNQYHGILRDVYWMAVYSENEATGNVLMYVYQNTPQNTKADNPIIAFNNWSLENVGLGAESGLHAWLSGKTICYQCADERYGKKAFVYGGKVLAPNNTYSPRDLALFYIHLATKGRELGYYDVAKELLSIQINEPGMLKFYANRIGVQSASKDGFVGPYSEDSDGYYISTDAGLLTLPDGSQYAVAFMAFDAGDLLANTITTTLRALVDTLPNGAVPETLQGATGH
jgi:hypothetical protein